jgi:hypothetical protein
MISLKRNTIHLLILLTLFLTASSIFAEEETQFFGTVLTASGEAYITRGIMEFDLKIEDELQFEDEIETGEDGHVQLSFRSSFISIGPNTCFTISKEEEEGAIVTLIEIDSGEVRSKIIDLKKGEGFRVDSINGSVLVTGTDFVTGVNPDNDALSVAVLHGSVKVATESEDGEQTSMPVINMQSMRGVGTDKKVSSTMNAKEVSKIKQKLPIPGDKGSKDSNPVANPVFGDTLLRIATALKTQSTAQVSNPTNSNNNSKSKKDTKKDSKKEVASTSESDTSTGEKSDSTTEETSTETVVTTEESVSSETTTSTEENTSETVTTTENSTEAESVTEITTTQPISSDETVAITPVVKTISEIPSIIDSINVEQIINTIALPQVNQVTTSTQTVSDTKEQIAEQQVTKAVKKLSTPSFAAPTSTN